MCLRLLKAAVRGGGNFLRRIKRIKITECKMLDVEKAPPCPERGGFNNSYCGFLSMYLSCSILSR